MNIEILKRIEINTGILCGKSVIKGTRISVELILEKLASGYNFDEKRIFKGEIALKVKIKQEDYNV